MCQVGDIILVYNAKYHGREVGPHQFLIVDDTPGKVSGMDYDVISNILSSMTTGSKQERYHKFPGNISIKPDDREIIRENNKDAFLSADELFYFNLDNLDYKPIGYLHDDVMELINDFVRELQEKDVAFEQITDNLTPDDGGRDDL